MPATTGSGDGQRAHRSAGALCGQTGFEQAVQAPCDIGVLGGILRGAGQRDFGKADLLLAGAANLLEAMQVWPRWRCASSSMPWPPPMPSSLRPASMSKLITIVSSMGATAMPKRARR
jgi:hypothetical protein